MIPFKTHAWLVLGVLVLFIVLDLNTLGRSEPSEPESSPNDTPPPEEVVIARVDDAITFIADSGQRIRYLGVRVPNIEQCFGREALQAQEAAIGQTVRLESDPVFERSADEAWMRYAFLDDPEKPDEDILISERILEGGFGFLLASENMKYAERLQGAARFASSTGRGLWSRCKPFQDEQGRWQTEELVSD